MTCERCGSLEIKSYIGLDPIEHECRTCHFSWVANSTPDRFANSPLVQHAEATESIFRLVRAEMVRQELLKAQGKFDRTCADEMPNTLRLTVLAEEFGEVAKEACEYENCPADVYIENMKEELVQVAAVACSWLLGLERERS